VDEIEGSDTRDPSSAELSTNGTSRIDRHVRAFPFPRFALTSFVTPLHDRRGQCESAICASRSSPRVAQFLVTIRSGK